MVAVMTILAAIAVFWFLAYHQLPAVVWIAALAAMLVGYGMAGWWSPGWLTVSWLALIVAGAFTVPSPLRRNLIGTRVLKLFRRILPAVSQTEQEALEAGTVWWDGELFSGRPDWKKLLAYPKPTLSCRGAGLH